MRISTAAATLLALACSPTVDFEVQRLCATIPQQSFPGVPAGPPGSSSATLPEVTISFDLGSGIPDLKKKGVKEAKISFEEMRLDSSSGGAAGPPTRFIQTLTIDLQPPPGSSLQPKRVVAYTRPAGTAPTALVVAGDGTNLVDYLEAGRLTAVVQGTGDPNQLPREAWAADATLCTHVQVTVDYLEASD
jgi:hypothetical protein